MSFVATVSVTKKPPASTNLQVALPPEPLARAKENEAMPS